MLLYLCAQCEEMGRFPYSGPYLAVQWTKLIKTLVSSN